MIGGLCRKGAMGYTYSGPRFCFRYIYIWLVGYVGRGQWVTPIQVLDFVLDIYIYMIGGLCRKGAMGYTYSGPRFCFRYIYIYIWLVGYVGRGQWVTPIQVLDFVLYIYMIGGLCRKGAMGYTYSGPRFCFIYIYIYIYIYMIGGLCRKGAMGYTYSGPRFCFIYIYLLAA